MAQPAFAEIGELAEIGDMHLIRCQYMCCAQSTNRVRRFRRKQPPALEAERHRRLSATRCRNRECCFGCRVPDVWHESRLVDGHVPRVGVPPHPHQGGAPKSAARFATLVRLGQQLPIKVALITTAMLSGIPNIAPASRSYYYDGDPLNVLPMGGAAPPSEQEILAKALAMPAVQRAMQEFEAIGFVRAPEYDKGGVGGDVTCAGLAYDVPGRPEAGAVLVARTAIEGGIARTEVFGGSFVLDSQGDMTPDTSPNAAGVVVTILDMNSSQASNYTTRDPRESARKFRDWVVCTVTLCGAVIAGCRYVFMPEAVGACSVVGCAGGAALCGI